MNEQKQGFLNKTKIVLKTHYILWIILAVSIIGRIVLITIPSLIWWDTAVYIGMGKAMYTLGHYGIWEVFRPLLWPILIGFLWKLGLNALLAGKILSLLFSLGCILLVYDIGERIQKNVGLIAAGLLSITPIFFYFTTVPLTDIPSVFFALLCLNLLLRDRYFWSGLALAAAVNTRFPHGLILVSVLVYILLYSQGENLKDRLKIVLRKGITFLVGFSVLIVPYLIFNHIKYHDALLPLKMGNKLIGLSTGPEDNIWFFITSLISNNFIIIFFIPGIIAFIASFKKIYSQKALTLIIISFIIVAGYFLYLSHKELRYSIAFLPYLILISSYGLILILKRTNSWIIVAAVAILTLIIGHSFIRYYRYYEPSSDTRIRYEQFYNYFSNKPNVTIISSVPMAVANANIKIDEIIDTGSSAYDAYRYRDNTINYIALDSCQTTCSAGDAICIKDKNTLLNKLKQQQILVYSDTVNQCYLTIYKLQPSIK